jgi:hypothetical protein
MTPFPLENQIPQDLSRRGFLQRASLGSLGLIAAGREPLPVDAAAAKTRDGQTGKGTGRAGDLPSGGKPIKLFCGDLNWVRLDKPVQETTPAAPQDWAFINPRESLDGPTMRAGGGVSSPLSDRVDCLRLVRVREPPVQ